MSFCASGLHNLSHRQRLNRIYEQANWISVCWCVSFEEKNTGAEILSQKYCHIPRSAKDAKEVCTWNENFKHQVPVGWDLLPPASAVEVIKTVPSVSVCVCVCVNTLTAEPFDIWSPNLVQGLTLIISWTSLIFKVIGQRSRSPSQKNSISGVFLSWVKRYQTVAYGVMSWRHSMTSCDIVAWRHDVTWHRRMTSTPPRGRCSNTLVFFTPLDDLSTV